MRIIYAPALRPGPGDDPGFEIEVRPRSRVAMLSDLFRTLGASDPGLATIDGRPVDTGVPIEESGLHEGAVLAAAGPRSAGAGPARAGAVTRAAFEAVTVAGLRGCGPGAAGVGRGYLIHNGEWDIAQVAAG